MNGGLGSHNLREDSRTEHEPIYRNKYASPIAPQARNTHLRHSHVPTSESSTHVPQHRYLDTTNQRHAHLSNVRQPLFLTNNNRLFGRSSAAVYYDRIRAQACYHASTRSQAKSSTLLRGSAPTMYSESNVKAIVGEPNMKYKDDPSLDYPTYTMDSLIEQLVPNDTRRSKKSFIHPMLLCSRLHIRPSLFLNKLAHLTIGTLKNLTHEQGVLVMQNFLYILSQWTETFPYDFRNMDMISQLDELLQKISSFDPSLRSTVRRIDTQLDSKLKALNDYEDYIQQLNKNAVHSRTHTTLSTDIIRECSSSLLFARQVTHIELHRLRSISAEELLQYFIMKSAAEEARTHPSRASASTATALNLSSASNGMHDTKLTFCFETYIHWFNRLTFFVATEIVKHTQRRLRRQLIRYFLNAAHECLSLHNFNSMFAILGGLNMQPVRRLKRTWEKEHLQKLEQLEQYKNVSKNFANYRNALKVAMEQARGHGWQMDDIVIPFASLISQDVYFIKTHSKDYTAEGGINLQKYYALSKFIFEEFLQCQQSKCSFERNDAIINYIITSPTFSENDLMLASFECEQAATPYEKELLAQLQNEPNKPSP